jgi:hypothetical protein
MDTHADKIEEKKSHLASNGVSQVLCEPGFQFTDNRPEALAQLKLQESANNSPQARQTAQLQAMADRHSSLQEEPIQKKARPEADRKGKNTALPDQLKTGMESLSGISLDDVKVYRNSDKPAQLQAYAYTKGTDIHLGPGQERYLPHEAWHVVQQKQGRVKPTTQLKNKININDDAGLEKEADVMGERSKQIKNIPNNIEKRDGSIPFGKSLQMKATNKGEVIQGMWPKTGPSIFSWEFWGYSDSKSEKVKTKRGKGAEQESRKEDNSRTGNRGGRKKKKSGKPGKITAGRDNESGKQQKESGGNDIGEKITATKEKGPDKSEELEKAEAWKLEDKRDDLRADINSIYKFLGRLNKMADKIERELLAKQAEHSTLTKTYLAKLKELKSTNITKSETFIDLSDPMSTLGKWHLEGKTMNDDRLNEVRRNLYPINNKLDNIDEGLSELLGVAENIGRDNAPVKQVGYIWNGDDVYSEATGSAKKDVIRILARTATGRTSPNGKSNHVHIGGNANYNVLFKVDSTGAIQILGFVNFHMDSSMHKGQKTQVENIEKRSGNFQKVEIDMVAKTITKIKS